VNFFEVVFSSAHLACDNPIDQILQAEQLQEQ